MPKSKPDDVTEPDGAPVDPFASVPIEERHQYEKEPCPKCGEHKVLLGYGLAFGGGCGTYWVCDACNHVLHKTHDNGE